MNHGRQTARQLMEAGLPRRYSRERRFRVLGMLAVSVGLTFLVLFFASIVMSGYKAFAQSQVALDVYLDPALISPTGATSPEALALGDYSGLVRQSLYDLFPDVSGRRDRRALAQLVSVGASYQLQNLVAADPDAIGETRRVWVPASADVDMVVKGSIDRTLPEESRPVKDPELAWIDRLTETGRLQLRFNTALFTNGDSRDPELAGIRGALMGSFYMLLVTVALAFPIGVAAAVYLEEFAPRNRWTDLIEVNINNLAAVPSIVFGLLGLAVFINWASLPRSSPLVGGLVLSLMTLPVIIIAARASIKAVPPSIKEAALGLGASKMQMVFQHVLPLALPGILTGTIIGMARALGETAPLLMIGMVAFIVDIPQGPLDPSAALPVQIYLWADSPERAFVERTSAAIIVLLGFLLVMNLTAVLLRRRFERSF
ncbi:MAG TPA: phosphate ABC transporter permease PstA [Woeseiaceae bacterium]|nr:phosphate ABC transporter permease PstA [Woeseiaceae bacterium]